MSKTTQKDSGEERVTAKSKPMMNLVSRCSERTLDVPASTASESPVKTRHESQFPLSSRTEQHHRTGRLVEDTYSSSYSEWNVDKTWSSQEWKSDELMEDRTGRPVEFAQHTDRFIVENDKMNSYTEAESEMSLKSRSFLRRVNDQVRKRITTQTLRATLKILNQPRCESYVYSEVEHLSASVGCATNERQYSTVLRSRKSFLWILGCAWMGCLLSIFGT